jgi:transcriptional regulator with XRE-family HTH domain
MSIGPRVRERRKGRGLSQEQLASQAGLTWSAIQRLEAGQVTDPHYSTLSNIAHVLDTTIADLVGEELTAPKASAPSAGPEEAEKLQRITRALATLAAEQERLTARLREIEAASSEVDTQEVAERAHEVAEGVSDRVQEVLEGIGSEGVSEQAEKQPVANDE